MPWIDTIPYAKSTGKLRTLYDRVKGPGDNVDNIMITHSPRPFRDGGGLRSGVTACRLERWRYHRPVTGQFQRSRRGNP